MENSSNIHQENGEKLKIEDPIQTNKSNEIELHKLGLLRSSVEKQDHITKEVDDIMLRRFLRARSLDVDKASTLFLKYLKWRREFIPNGSVSELEIARDLGDMKFFLQGMDKDGRPIALIFAGKHFPSKAKGGLEEFKRYIVYVLDKLCSRIPKGEEKFVIIADLQGWGYSNCDIRGYIGALSILQVFIATTKQNLVSQKLIRIQWQDCYPERLGKLLIVHVPYIFMTAWKIIYPLIDSNTREKITFVDKRKLTSTLLHYIEESQLPHIYGGKLQLVPIQSS